VATNTLHTCEFTDGLIIASKIPVKQRCRFFDRDQDIYAWIVTDDSFFVIGGDGSVQKLVAEQEPSDESDEYRVPLSFWSLATQATPENSTITGTDSSQNYSTLYEEHVAYFHTNVTEKVLTFHVLDPSNAIVGVMLGFARIPSEHRPPYVVIKGRRINTKADFNHLIPLMPCEVRPGEKVDLLFPAPATADIAIQSAVIFIMKSEQIRPFLCPAPQATSWLTDPYDLFDFADVIPKDAPNIQKLAHLIATMIFPRKGQEFDPELLRRIVRCLYSSSSVSLAARSALVRIAAVKPDLAEDWAGGLRDALRAGEVGHEMWDFVWRDFSLLPQECQASLQTIIWDAAPKVGCLASVLSAFSFQSE
jgi:hypothetical protein